MTSRKDTTTNEAAKVTKGWLEESAGQAEKWAGKVTGNEAKEAEGAARQKEGNDEKHLRSAA